jgi:hypothetical protein
MNSICSRRLHHNTLVYEIDIHMGSLWAVFIPTDTTGVSRVGIVWDEVKDYIRNKLP